MSLDVGGAGRTSSLPSGLAQPGPGAVMVAVRGGLAGGRLEAGYAVVVPWHMAWDLKLGLLREEGAIPAVAVRADLGLFQPSFGGALLVTKSVGPVSLTLIGEAGRRNERVWQTGTGPYAETSENLVKRVLGAGAELAIALPPLHEVYVNVTHHAAQTEHEAPRRGAEFKAEEGPSWFFGAGVRLTWSIPKAPPTPGPLTALRGVILEVPGPEGMEVGQPGIYKATVLMDDNTKVLFDGKPVERAEMTQGRAVLIQGIALPKPSTFLARTIELQ